MKVLLYSSVFWPSIGGIETITATLAENIVRLGHECTVVTETHSDQQDSFIYRVVRQPTFRERLELVRQCSLVHSNGASVAMYPFAKLGGKPFIWTHNGYQVSCVDGLGWLDGEPTPLTPLASLAYHFRKKGIFHGLKEAFKLGMRRYIANHVDLNIAATNWVAKRQPLKNQIVAYTPYPLRKFENANKFDNDCKYDFLYVGRLVSEKGLPELIRAFHSLVLTPGYEDKYLAIVGSGKMKPKLEEMLQDLGLDKNVFLLGPKHGSELNEIIAQAKIGVVPSAYEEPMGGVSLELLAAGKNVIVSEFGGHAECVGDAALKFPNGDIDALSKCMLRLLTDTDLVRNHQENALIQLKMFDEIRLTQRYIEIYEEFSLYRSSYDL